jgi:hypothetical protein
LPCSKDEHEEVDDSSDMEAPLPTNRASKNSTQDHANAETKRLSSAHHSEGDVSLFARRKYFVDETDSRGQTEGGCNA